MPNLGNIGNIVQKAFYLGVGLAATASEEAGDKLAKLRVEAQNLADALVAKGEMNVEEARKLVEELMQQAQQETVQPGKTPNTATTNNEPRRIEILSDDEAITKAATDNNDVDALRKQVQAMQDELRRLKRD
jgi:polyhydroxyalkanoate synthesis regulator phasin